MKRTIAGMVIIGLSLCIFGYLTQAACAVGSTPKNSLKNHFIQVDGLKRSYRLYAPEGGVKMKNIPVIVSLHGGGGKARGQANWFPFFRTEVGKDWIVVYPQGVSHRAKTNWSDGRIHLVKGRERYAKINDVKFLFSVIDHLAQTYDIDRKNIFFHGVSNGAFMSQRIAVEHADRVAGIAAVIGSLAHEFHYNFSPTRPVPVLMMNGTEDTLIPYEGGMARLKNSDKRYYETVAVEKTLNRWVTHNQCAPNPKVDYLPDLDKEDGCTIERRVYEQCEGGAEVQFLKLIGGGHTSPGDKEYKIYTRYVGRTCQDIKSTDYIMDFFSRLYISSR